ncbi:MAG: EamA family transporter [Gammaproteobacteria bacterium]|nr:EamA family transporter [Gammaproteobacteria bacterium]
MMASMAAFAMEDAFIKRVSEFMPTGQILMIFGLGGASVFLVIALIKGDHLFNSAVLSSTMIVRAICELIGRLFYVLAITLAPLSSATAILQATPIVVVAGAAILFGEKVGIRRWFAIFCGLFGVLIVLQPGTDGFTFFSFLAVLGMLGFAGRDLATRACSMSIRTSVLGFYGFATVVVAGMGYSFWDESRMVSINDNNLVMLAGAVAAGVVAYMSLMMAMRTGEVSAVTPFRYSRLLFGLTIGVFIFEETVNANMLIGCSLVVISGVYVLHQGGRITIGK